MNNIVDKIKNGLVVSCQALEDEPLHGDNIMAKMAVAAKQGGAVCIRANSKVDIASIKKSVDLPVIGLIKRVYNNSEVYITPTMEEIDDVVLAGADIVAIDFTLRKRPDGRSLEELVNNIRENHKDIMIMADISTYEEGIEAEKLGVDFISTTLSGYTTYSPQIEGPDFELLKRLVKDTKTPVIAEGRISTPEEAKKALEHGATAVVVGGAITRPQQITKKFVDGIKG